MFARTAALLIAKGSKTLDHLTRVTGPIPIRRLQQGRRKCYQARFMDMGPNWSRVWCAIPGGSRQKRHAKSRDKMRDRFIWRPIERGYQRLYVQENGQRYRRPRNVPIPRLRASNNEIGLQSYVADGHFFRGPERFGNGPPKGLPGYHGDFRVL